jgi:hypothetical protein
MKLISIGLEDTYPEYLKRKIVISNMIALVIAFLVALPFVFISLIFFSTIGLFANCSHTYCALYFVFQFRPPS